MSARMRGALCAALGVLLAVPCAAQAAEKTVQMGVPRASQRAFESTASDVNDFFPHQVTIHVGDTVRFVPATFHTVDLPGRRTKPLPVLIPSGQAVAGSVDAAGAPFWFNGQPALGFNPVLLRFGFGKRLSYTGAKAVLSGVPVSNRPRPMTVRFSRAGSFRYFCDVHPGMTGRVRVVGRNRRVPSARADARTLRNQIATALRTARALSKAAAPPANTIDVGRQSRGGVDLLAFVPSTLTVPVGTTVTFRMQARSEVHTATSGPGDPVREPTSYLGQIAASLESPVFDPRALYRSDPPPAPLGATLTVHGNGFWSTGALDAETATPSPQSDAVQFRAPGTYQVYCMIHPFMHGTITVQ